MSTKDDDPATQTARQFLARADEASDLFERARLLFSPFDSKNYKAHEHSLALRWKAGDVRVVKYCADQEYGIPDYFKLVWGDNERKDLINRYMKERDWSGWCGTDDERRLQAKLFVGILEEFGDGIPLLLAIEPPIQKERQRKLDSVSNAFAKLVDSLNALDSAALGWLLASMEEKAAVVGMTLRPSGPDVASLKDNPVRAQVEAGEIRARLTLFASAVGAEISQAGKSLPRAERDDPRLGIAFSIERLMFEHRIPFTTTETGFAAECLRAICDLGGLDTEAVSYWLRKADETPDSERPFNAVLKSWRKQAKNDG